MIPMTVKKVEVVSILRGDDTKSEKFGHCMEFIQALLHKKIDKV